MGKPKHTKESIIQTLKNISARLGRDSLSKADVAAHIPESCVRYHFGSVGAALTEAGLSGAHRREHTKLSDSELFESIRRVEIEKGHEPTGHEYDSNGQYSQKPFRDRFGKWSDALAYYRKWKAENGVSVSEQPLTPAAPVTNPSPVELSSQTPRALTAQRRFGEFINFRNLPHAPTTELEVVFLFGMVSRELGFAAIESIRPDFPDCEAKYQVAGRGLARVHVEFELKSSHFREHSHDPTHCDLIVCWEHDWADCPVQVIELRKEILKFPNV